ncbi:hypothetical protein ABIB85_000079 [Bradyrhizobium sp. JR1.5]
MKTGMKIGKKISMKKPRLGEPSGEKVIGG